MKINNENFKIKKLSKDIQSKPINISFVPPTDDDALGIASAFSSTGNSSFFSSNSTQDTDYTRAIIDCRATALHPLVKKILDHIEMEAFPVSSDVTGRSSKINVKLCTEDLEDTLPSRVIEAIHDAFEKTKRLLRFKVTGSKKFRNWYIDGKQAYHVIADKNGIVELREIDTLNLRKIRKEVYGKVDGIEVITDYETKYIYIPSDKNNNSISYTNSASPSLEIDETAIIFITSGMLNETGTRTVSHLESLIKPTQNLAMIEDSHIIMRVSSATRTRIFYVDIGVHQGQKAEKLVREIQSKLKHNVEYDTKTGRLKDNRRFISVLNDIFIPRVTGTGQTTEIKQLPGDENIDKIADLQYFRNDLIEKSPVPKQRLSSNQSFSLGKSNELSREETVFHKQIEGLRQRFAELFHETMKRELILKNVMSGEDYDEFRDDIYFIFPTDNHYKMMLEFELLDEKIQRIQAIGHDPRIFFPIEMVANTICGYNDKEIEKLKIDFGNDILYAQEVEMQRQALEFERMKEINPEIVNTEEPN